MCTDTSGGNCSQAGGAELKRGGGGSRQANPLPQAPLVPKATVLRAGSTRILALGPHSKHIGHTCCTSEAPTRQPTANSAMLTRSEPQPPTGLCEQEPTHLSSWKCRESVLCPGHAELLHVPIPPDTSQLQRNQRPDHSAKNESGARKTRPRTTGILHPLHHTQEKRTASGSTEITGQ